MVLLLLQQYHETITGHQPSTNLATVVKLCGQTVKNKWMISRNLLTSTGVYASFVNEVFFTYLVFQGLHLTGVCFEIFQNHHLKTKYNERKHTAFTRNSH
jgi:hypothetical protein